MRIPYRGFVTPSSQWRHTIGADMWESYGDMRIAIVTETFPPEINGVAMTFEIIARELAAREHSVTIYRPWRKDLLPEQISGSNVRGFGEVVLPGMPLPGYPTMRLGLPAGGKFRRFWTDLRPDLVHVVTEGPLGASAISAARALGIPVTSSFHTNFHQYMRHYRAGILGRVAVAWLRHVHNRTAQTFVPTRELCHELENYGFQNLSLLSRGVDTRLFSPSRRSMELREAWGAVAGNPVVIHAGRVAAEKNLTLVRRVFATMWAANPDCRFVVVGDGPLRARLQHEMPWCIFPGFVSRDELARYFASADIYVHASLTETFGNVFTEAMASGLAVAGFDYAAARQFVRDGENGLLAPCDEPCMLVEAAVRLASEPKLRAKLGGAARVTAASFSWSNVIAKFEADLVAVAHRHSVPKESPNPASPQHVLPHD